MSKYVEKDIHTYTIVNGIVVVGDGNWVFLNDETKDKINAMIIEACNDPTKHRKRVDGKFVK